MELGISIGIKWIGHSGENFIVSNLLIHEFITPFITSLHSKIMWSFPMKVYTFCTFVTKFIAFLVFCKLYNEIQFWIVVWLANLLYLSIEFLRLSMYIITLSINEFFFLHWQFFCFLFIFLIALTRTHSKMLTSSADSGHLCLFNFREYFQCCVSRMVSVIFDLLYQNKGVPFYS